MTETKGDLRERHFSEAQAVGWEYTGTIPQPSEGLGRKEVLQFRHPQHENLSLFIGPRGGLKTGRSYRSSACKFWTDTPSLTSAVEAHNLI